MAYLVSRLELGPGRVVADVAAGTGKLTRLLVPNGARVIAVEPLAEMRSVLAETSPSVEVVAGTAEELPLDDGSVDAVTVAQAFHWFDAPAAVLELARVLRPRGALAVVFNIRDLDDPLQHELNELLRPYYVGQPSEHDQPWRADVEASPSFGAAEVRSFSWVQPHSREELAARVASISFVAALASDVRERLLERVRRVVDEGAEPFPFRYRTEVLVFPRSRDQEAER